MALLQVKTESGMIEGLTGWNQAVGLFRGIPYAKAPVGNLRWKAPEPVEPWEGVLKAYNWGPISYQERRASEGGGDLIGEEFYCVEWPRSEDCLYLNVWTPAKSANEKLPVGVYLHGGGYAQGYGHLNCYDGEGFAKRGIVTVTLNHRLGIFGYLAHPELTAEDEHHTSGNYGMLDIIEALKWVKKNISAFGGDPDQITVFGQSGGGGKSVMMLTTPLTDGIVKGAIMQSGGGVDMTRGELHLKEAEENGKKVIDFMGYASVDEARKASPEELLKKIREYCDNNPLKMMGLFGPNADGYVFPKHWNRLVQSGEFKDVPTMIGCTAQEFVADKFIAGGSFKLPDREKAFADGERDLGDGEAYLRAIKYDTDPEYAAKMYSGYVRTYAMYAADIAFSESQIANGHKPAYQYYLTLVPPTAETAHHSAEHQYVFQTLTKSKRPYAGRDWDLSNQLADYWANFIKYGNPNGDGLPQWTPYTADCKQVMDIDYNLHMIDLPTNDLIELQLALDLK
ncbi:carboxylesterase family protein [Lachnospiraceae bacterium CLA-AA-H215]|uniref:Carboxylic ester hydrolase n=1 Tax=Hominifimenecus microfluidus TaxID=2885348 RepID=A0AAE3ECR4_9FIRM|nr:carboxylesterase family protein [Hominifimenecus microfluidus]MCC2232772.1 carboxylesterase family protein [Hominifimenecus microfluidus]